MPYVRPRTKKGFFKKYEYTYDEFYDCFICPNNEVLNYSTTDRKGYKIYKSNPEKCKNCPLKNQCTESKNFQKLLQDMFGKNIKKIQMKIDIHKNGRIIIHLEKKK